MRGLNYNDLVWCKSIDECLWLHISSANTVNVNLSSDLNKWHSCISPILRYWDHPLSYFVHTWWPVYYGTPWTMGDYGMDWNVHDMALKGHIRISITIRHCTVLTCLTNRLPTVLYGMQITCYQHRGCHRKTTKENVIRNRALIVTYLWSRRGGSCVIS